jgi:PHD/YefM family antitoxin component YafN of YafNO toxin-antitoxin module
MSTLTAREFNQDAGGAKRAALAGPVFITDRGQPSHVLLTFDDFRRLAARHGSIVDLLSLPADAGQIDLPFHHFDDAPTPALFD